MADGTVAIQGMKCMDKKAVTERTWQAINFYLTLLLGSTYVGWVVYTIIYRNWEH